jgi:DinB superfamily
MMRHNREEVIIRTIQEFELLDHLVANLSGDEWKQLLLRPEVKDPWTVKDALAHITHWKADVARSARRQRRPSEEQGLETNAANHLIYLTWHNRSPQEVLAWHRQVQEDVLVALRAAPEAWFRGRERRAEWPYDLDGHSAYHRVKDIERALRGRK